MKVTAIFDIGKSNKKFFLFNEDFQEVHRVYAKFDEIEDDEGFPCDDITAIENWMKESFHKAAENPKFQIKSVNFSGYGASFVHLDKNGKPLLPLYNYLKPYPEDILTSFHKKYGDTLTVATETASPPLGMLNSGLQLYWLKYTKPEIFKKIRWSLHLPQYLSFIFTGIPLSDYTSVGCHTMLWDYAKGDYHKWIYEEEIDHILPPLTQTHTSINRKIGNREYKMGVGIHDSSAALLPYKKLSDNPFLLLSTGTWSICLNPFNHEPLTANQLDRDCLNFLGIDGKMVKASRLFLGNEYKIWTARLAQHFEQPRDMHRSIKPNAAILNKLPDSSSHVFKWESITSVKQTLEETDLTQFENYETAYHKLMQELVGLQIEAIQLSKGNTPIKKIFLDGGFADNELFIHFLKLVFDNLELVVTQKPLGSAIGAAMVLRS